MKEDMNSSSIGFLSLYQLSNTAEYMASLLITDHSGVPQEFKSTESVKPSTLERTLYGKALEPYIGVHLCGIPLVKSVKVTPALIIVDKDYLLEVREESAIPIVLVHALGQQINVTSSDVDETSRGVQPLDIRPHPKYPDDKIYAQRLIESSFGRLDLVEPFSRMLRAVEMLREKRGSSTAAGLS
jgi:hypothetical protein